MFDVQPNDESQRSSSSESTDEASSNIKDINSEIEFQVTEFIPEKTFYGKTLYFFMSASLIRSLLLWPFLKEDMQNYLVSKDLKDFAAEKQVELVTSNNDKQINKTPLTEG